MVLHLARYELRYLFIGLLILFISSSFFLFYVMYLEKNEVTRIIYSDLAIDVSAGVAFIASLLILKGNNEGHDKSFTFLAIGLGVWFCAELTYTYYQNSCNVSVLYPSIADLLWLAGYIFVGTHLYKTFRVWNETKRIKFYSIIIASLIAAVLVGNHWSLIAAVLVYQHRLNRRLEQSALDFFNLS